jgi:outer membrane receptor protein involved in Fe transport
MFSKSFLFENTILKELGLFPAMAIVGLAVGAPAALAATQAANNAGNGAQSQDPSGSGEIVVTATRSAAPITKIPVSVMALTNEALDKQGVRSIDDLTRLVPGVSFTRGLGPVSSISIRGVSSNSGAATTGVYINDTPIQTRRIGQGGTVFNAYPAIFDLDRVEVLRGRKAHCLVRDLRAVRYASSPRSPSCAERISMPARKCPSRRAAHRAMKAASRSAPH